MAAQEYYLGTQAVYELPGQRHPTPYPQKQPQPQYQQPLAQPYPVRPQYNAPSYSTPPPTYSAYPGKQQPYPRQHAPQQQFPVEKPHQYPPRPQFPNEKQQHIAAPYPTAPPVTYHPQQQSQPGYLDAPLQPFRSHSQPPPPRVRFADQESDRSTDLGETDSSDDSASRRTHRSRHHRYRSHDRVRDDRDRDTDYSDSDREPERRRHKHHHRPRETKTQSKEHKNRDTFLGAGAGTIIGDAILPGLGTAAGLLLGGYGGRKYAERGCSEDSGKRDRDGRRRKDSYDESDEERRRKNRR
ncbi:hypothetical protein NX059_001552 [Plenodomus lindquistii]|nr:hypothetical protein NX059_001552 [Plenodomus lindquistii]